MVVTVLIRGDHTHDITLVQGLKDIGITITVTILIDVLVQLVYIVHVLIVKEVLVFVLIIVSIRGFVLGVNVELLHSLFNFFFFSLSAHLLQYLILYLFLSEFFLFLSLSFLLFSFLSLLFLKAPLEILEDILVMQECM